MLASPTLAKARELVVVGSLLGDILKHAPGLIDEAKWRRVVGPSVAKRAMPHKLEGKVLIVRVATSAWAQELTMLKQQLIERLLAQGFEVHDMRFRVGPIEPPRRDPSVQVHVPRFVRMPLPDQLADEIGRVDDDDLRVAIARAAQTNLSWQRALAAPRKVISGLRGAQALLPAAARSAQPARTSPTSREEPPGSRATRRG